MTARWNWLPDVDPCDMPIGRGQTCTKPGDHLDGCDWPLPRCRCSHGPSVHTGGYGRCHSLSCACARYVDPPEHPAGKAIPARFDERYDPSPEPIDRSIQ